MLNNDKCPDALEDNIVLIVGEKRKKRNKGKRISNPLTVLRKGIE